MSRVTDRLNRREVLGGLGALGLTGIGVAMAPESMHLSSARAAEVASHADHDDLAMTSNLQSDELTADEMDAMHEAGVKAFPAQTNGKGGLPLEFTMDGDVKVFELTCEVVDWEYNVGKTVEAWTYNGVVPGPEIRATEGDTGALQRHQQAPAEHRGPLARTLRSERPGRRSLHHAAADQTGRDLYLRVHDPGRERRFPHVPLASQRRLPGDVRSARRVHRGAEGSRPAARRTTSSTR